MTAPRVESRSRVAAAARWPWAPLPPAAVARDRRRRTPIKHFVVLMQENHSFDNYFGTYPGADGIPRAPACRSTPHRPGGGCVEPFHLGDRRGRRTSTTDADATRRQYNGGRMDGFVAALARAGGQVEPTGDGLLRRARPPVLLERRRRVRPVRPLLQLGRRRQRRQPHVLGRRDAGHARRAGDPAEGFGDLPTIFDRLEESGYLLEVLRPELRPGITYRTQGAPATERRRSCGCRCSLRPLPRRPGARSRTSST